MHLNELRQRCLKVTNHVIDHGMSYVKHQKIAWFIQKFFRKRINDIIKLEAKQEDILNVCCFIKKEIDPIFKEFDYAEMVREGEELGSIKVPNIGKMVETRTLINEQKRAEKILKEMGY